MTRHFRLPDRAVEQLGGEDRAREMERQALAEADRLVARGDAEWYVERHRVVEVSDEQLTLEEA